MKRKIIFIPCLYYLANELFFSIARKFIKYETIYFDTKEPDHKRFNEKGIKKNTILNYFDSYCKVNFVLEPPCKKLNRIRRLFKTINDNRKYIKNINYILDNIKPIAIISSGDMFYSMRICSQWAKENNIPVFIIQPSPIYFSKFYFGSKPRYLLYNKILNIPKYNKQTYFGNENKNNYVFLWGEYLKSYYRRKEVFDNIYITGNPSFDKYFIEKGKASIELYRILDIPLSKNIIVICTRPIEHKEKKSDFDKRNNIYKNLLFNNDYFFIIKIHPRENIEKYKKLFEDINRDNYRIIKNTNLYLLLKIAGVVISTRSNTLIESIVVGVPIIVFEQDNKYKVETPDYFENGIGLRATTLESLFAQIKKCFTKEYRKKFKMKREGFIKSKLYSNDGKSGERIVKKIEEIIEKNI